MIYPESILRHPLPAIPEYFLKELPKIAVRNGMPLFRIVNGQTETQFRNGKIDVKHLLRKGNEPCYVTVAKTRYRRKNIRTDEYVMYTSFEKAKDDKTKGLSFEIETATIEKRVGVGRPCWVIEVYMPPEDIGTPADWEAFRYEYLEKGGVVQKIDLLGPYPTEGRYIACFDVIDDEGNAVAPDDKTLQECKRRFSIVSNDNQTVDDAIQASNYAIEQFEAKTLDKMNDDTMQSMGITAKRMRGAEISRPILVTK